MESGKVPQDEIAAKLQFLLSLGGTRPCQMGARLCANLLPIFHICLFQWAHDCAPKGHGRAPCLGLEKPLFLITFCSESNLGLFMKVLGMDVSFTRALVWLHSEIHSLSYDQTTTHGSAQSCTLPRHRKNQLFHHFLFRIGFRRLHKSCRYWC
jgi:hypothetical protein